MSMVRQIVLVAATISAMRAAKPDYTIPVRVIRGFRLEVSVLAV